METHRDVARPLVRQLGALPTVDASLTRLAADRLRSAKIDLKPVLLRAGLTQEQISDPDNRIAMQSQVAFLNVAAEALDDDTLGLTLAAELDCRNVGLLYYVLASSDTLGTALERASRYSRVTNETLVLEYRKGPEPAQRLSYASIPRHAARHQVEFFDRRGNPDLPPPDWTAIRSDARVDGARAVEGRRRVLSHSRD